MANPVLILGAGLRLTVTIARSLHRQAIPVIVAPVSSDEAPIKSRSIQKHVVLPDFRSTPQEFLEELINLIQRESIDMIIPTGDGAMAALSAHYEALAELVHLGTPPPSIMERVLNKNLTLAAAQQCGIPVPASRTIERPSEIMNEIKGLQFPVIAKPGIRKGQSGYKVRYFMSVDDLAARVGEDTESWEGALIQEYIPGIGKGVGVLMNNGTPLVMFQHRRIKEWPYTGGVSVTAEAEVVDPRLGQLAVALLKRIEWQGIAMVEYRYNPQDDRFFLMEINGRYWGSLFLPAHVGVDFPYYEWQLAHGLQPDPRTTYQAGTRVRWLAGDCLRLHGIVDGSHRNEIQTVSPGKEIKDFLMDFGPRTHDAVWTLKDPMPAVQELQETLLGLGKLNVKRMVRTFVPDYLLKQIKTYRTLGPSLRPIFYRQQWRRAVGLQPILFRPDRSTIHQVLFLCHGNIIRSPTAAIFLADMLNPTTTSLFTVESAGLWEGLNRVEPRASPEIVREVAEEFGISLESHRSQPITRDMVDESDVIFVMDHRNESMLLKQYPHVRTKTFFLEACIEPVSLDKLEIVDPYGGTKEEVRACFASIQHRINGLAQLLVPQGQRVLDPPLPHQCSEL